jgi:quercetin dioxygenase-like cupin family protein
MIRSPWIPVAALAAAIAASAPIGPNPRAEGQTTQTPQEVVTPLLKTPLAGVAGKEVDIVHISAPPGFVTEHHIHPGQLFVYVLDGSVTIEVDGMAPVKLGPGDVFQEPAGKAMVGRNQSSTHGAELLVIQIGEKGAPLMVKAE